jgi:hypothetical protein
LFIKRLVENPYRDLLSYPAPIDRDVPRDMYWTMLRVGKTRKTSWVQSWNTALIELLSRLVVTGSRETDVVSCLLPGDLTEFVRIFLRDSNKFADEGDLPKKDGTFVILDQARFNAAEEVVGDRRNIGAEAPWPGKDRRDRERDPAEAELDSSAVGVEFHARSLVDGMGLEVDVLSWTSFERIEGSLDVGVALPNEGIGRGPSHFTARLYDFLARRDAQTPSERSSLSEFRDGVIQLFSGYGASPCEKVVKACVSWASVVGRMPQSTMRR